MLSWNHSTLSQVPGLPKLIPDHLYRARWIASVPCAAIPQTGNDPVVLALQSLGFEVVFATTDSTKLYGRTPPWPDSRKGPPDEASPAECAVYTEQKWAGAELSFIPEVLTSIPGLRIWDLWDEDADPTERDLIRRGVAVTPTALPPVPVITPPVSVPPIVPPQQCPSEMYWNPATGRCEKASLPFPPPVVVPPVTQAPAKKSSSVAWLWIPVAGLVGAIFVGTLRKAR